MTKRLLLAVVLVSAFATAAGATQGRVAIVYPSNLTSNSTGYGGMNDLQKRNMLMLTDVLDRGGVSYFMLPGKMAKVEQLRRGVIALGSQVDTVAGVIHMSFWGNVSANAQNGYRGDSLTRITGNSTPMGCDVPHLFISDNLFLMSNATAQTSMSDAAAAAANRCSTGVTGDKASVAQGQGIFWYGDKTVRLTNTPYTSGWKLNSSGPGGGLRPILGMSSSGRSIQWSDIGATNRNAFWPDSMPFVDASDTLLVWERLWNIATIPTAKPQVFCEVAGAGATADSTANADGASYEPCEVNLSAMLVGLARFDSLCGGIFRRPIQGAVTVQNALSRGLQRWKGGIAPGDTAVFYGSLDSLKAWGVPVTFYANVDSASTYARDVIKLKEVGQAKFSPQVWDGVADTTKGNTWVAQSSTNTGLPRDIFGRHVVRAIYGDGTGVGKDSSAWAQLKSAKARRDSVFGSNRASRSIRAPLDDFSPKLKTANGSVGWADSLMWMLAESDIGALVVNGRSLDLNRSAGLPSAFTRQQTYKPTIGTKSMNILAHNGGMLCGGQYQQFAYNDSATVFARVGNIEREIARALAGMCLESYVDYDIFQYDDVATAGMRNWDGVRFENEDMFPTMFPKRGSIVNLSCADLSGAAAAPARSGLHVIKTLWNTQRIVNAMAGRPIFQLTYPENVRP